MNKANLEPACMAAHLSTKQLTSDGLLVLTGAAAILDGGQPGMIGYGVSKISTHYLATSMVGDASFKDSKKSVLTVCPTTIDTPGNRSAMPDANFDSWTKPEEISEKCMNWVNDITTRPKSGSLLRVDGSGKSLTWS
jgi:dihydropteridine reductase